ncbi:hypothetical protein [Helicobacter suis]|nr:hypothetical protein [Helicobacter suis]
MEEYNLTEQEEQILQDCEDAYLATPDPDAYETYDDEEFSSYDQGEN